MNNSVARRWFLTQCGLGLGAAAAGELLAADTEASQLAGRKRTTHHAPRARAVIHLFMAGAPSQLELFDNKPTLSRLEGKPLPPSVIGDQRYAFIQPDAAVLGPRFKFDRHGETGLRAVHNRPRNRRLAP